MSRYEKPKILWEFCIKKSQVKRGLKKWLIQVIYLVMNQIDFL
jgi:hypothetical protein